MLKSPHPTDKHVGSRVRMRRLMLGLSQTKLADELGLTFQQVQKYEKGANRISASKLQHISNFLQAPIPFFFEGLTEPSTTLDGAGSPSHVFQFLSTTDGLSLAQSFSRISNAKLRHSIVGLVEHLATEASE
jgi:transcriptional regulator with XRE-family HTH domain